MFRSLINWTFHILSFKDTRTINSQCQDDISKRNSRRYSFQTVRSFNRWFLGPSPKPGCSSFKVQLWGRVQSSFCKQEYNLPPTHLGITGAVNCKIGVEAEHSCLIGLDFVLLEWVFGLRLFEEEVETLQELYHGFCWLCLFWFLIASGIKQLTHDKNGEVKCRQKLKI